MIAYQFGTRRNLFETNAFSGRMPVKLLVALVVAVVFSHIRPIEPVEAHFLTLTSPEQSKALADAAMAVFNYHPQDANLKNHVLRGFTVATKLRNDMGALLHSAEVNGVGVRVEGMGNPKFQRWGGAGFFEKLRYQHDVAASYRFGPNPVEDASKNPADSAQTTQTNSNSTILLFLDSYDVLIDANSDEIMRRYLDVVEKTKCRIVFNAEKWCGGPNCPGNQVKVRQFVFDFSSVFVFIK